MFICFNCKTLCQLVFQGKLFTGTLAETGRVLVLNTKDQDFWHTFVAAALYTWSDNIPTCWEKMLSEVSDFPFWCLSDRVSGNSGVLLVLVHRRNLLLQNNIYLVMMLLACCWSHSFSKQVSDRMMPWSYFSSLKNHFLRGNYIWPFYLFCSIKRNKNIWNYWLPWWSGSCLKCLE